MGYALSAMEPNKSSGVKEGERWVRTERGQGFEFSIFEGDGFA